MLRVSGVNTTIGLVGMGKEGGGRVLRSLTRAHTWVHEEGNPRLLEIDRSHVAHTGVQRHGNPVKEADDKCRTSEMAALRRSNNGNEILGEYT